MFSDSGYHLKIDLQYFPKFWLLCYELFPSLVRSFLSACSEHGLLAEYDVCSLSSDAGPCRNNITVKWYFNEDSGECQRFLYGGCDGNANRFETEKECKKICILRPNKGISLFILSKLFLHQLINPLASISFVMRAILFLCV